MKLISHRGNLDGKDPYKENSINYINNALNKGFDVEIDIWYNNGFWLGHDEPIHKTDRAFLENSRLWCHAKNLAALLELSKINTRYFWHENDKYTITSDNIIWAYPGQPINEQCVCVLPEINNTKYLDIIHRCYGVCSDFIMNWKNT